MVGRTIAQGYVRVWRIVVALLLVASLLVVSDTGRAQTELPEDVELLPSAQLYFSETGQTVTGPFLSYWLKHRDIGLPVSSHVQHGEHWTQWFEYARLELRWVPFDEATVEDIYLAELGVEFANRVGYAARLAAFKPKASGPERFFPDTGHSIQKGFREAYERWGMPERLGPPISDEFAIGATTYQFFQFGAFLWEPGMGVEQLELGVLDAGVNGHLATWQPQPYSAIDVDSIDVITLSDMMAGERWIEIDLSEYELTAWVGEQPVLRSTVVIGAPLAATPEGTFEIYIKYESQDMSGNSWRGGTYFEAGVPWVMYFYQDYAIHGSTWRTTYGYADSEGCVIPPNEVGELLYEWADYGTRVWVHE